MSNYKHLVTQIQDLSNKLRKRQHEYEDKVKNCKDQKHSIRFNAKAQECALCNQDLIILITKDNE